MLEFDHVMVGASDPEAAVEALAGLGVTLGTRGVHPGQGTSNACFYFENGYIELAWISTAQELPAADEIGLAARLRPAASGASPIGVSFRPVSERRDWPFRTWGWRAPFLPEGAIPIPVLANSDRRHEPLLFVSYFPGAPSKLRSPPPLRHALGLREVTGVLVRYVADGPPSEELVAVETLGLATFVPADAHGVEITFDHGRQRESFSVEPAASLVIKW